METNYKEQIINELVEKGVYEAIGDGISIQDTNFKILYQNKIHKSIIGDHVGEYCYKAYEKKEKTCNGCPLVETFKDGNIYTKERSTSIDKRTIYVEITSSPIKVPTGEIIAGVEIVRDITKRKRLEEEKSLFIKAISASTDGIALTDENDTYIYVNDAHAIIYGYTPEELHGKSWRDLVPSEIIASSEQSISETLHNKEIGTLKGEFLAFKKDGSLIPTEVRAKALWDKEGNYKGHICVVTNISERKKAEETLKEERDKSQKYFDTAQVMLVVIGIDQKLHYINRKGCEILGCIKEEVIGKNWYDTFIPKRNIRKVRVICENLFAGEIKTGEYFEYEVLTRKGEEKIIGWYFAALTDEKGDIIGAINSGEDITERKRIEKELNERVTELEEFYEMAVARELKMKELKKKTEKFELHIKKLQSELSKYKK
ncbi:MAG: PAS domain-containing protein [Planctomycetota bacterium]|jgi:PAS domain S-box-containing protein